MKKDIHPEYYPEAQVVCGCGNSFVTGATKPLIKTDICSACHPFFTGEQRIVDATGQVERYMKRLEKKEEMGRPVAVDVEAEIGKRARSTPGKGKSGPSRGDASKGREGRQKPERT
jgi:large subunit ribosomal protein L31